ncbi:Hypothetical predicted protein [Pelobates cultripes]|nr:Hypothetical predicted protein [Pelobates cultripes]
MSEIPVKDNFRILLYHHHFIKLKVKQKICLLKRILAFYELVFEKVFTTKVPVQTIYAVKDLLQVLGGRCLKCHGCQNVFQNRVQVNGKLQITKRYTHSCSRFTNLVMLRQP